jgi:glucosamine-phosphate N-acetyltransferase
MSFTSSSIVFISGLWGESEMLGTVLGWILTFGWIGFLNLFGLLLGIYLGSLLKKICCNAVKVPMTQIILPVQAFPSNLLSLLPARLSWKEIPAEMTSDEYTLRRLQSGDNKLGHLDLLKQLTAIEKVSDEMYEQRVKRICSHPDDYIMLIIERRNKRTGISRIVGCGTILIEYKFIHGAGKVAHIEDVVVDESERGKHMGAAIVSMLHDISSSLGCYKAILDCDARNVKFYAKLGFLEKAKQMAFYFK